MRSRDYPSLRLAVARQKGYSLHKSVAELQCIGILPFFWCGPVAQWMAEKVIFLVLLWGRPLDRGKWLFLIPSSKLSHWSLGQICNWTYRTGRERWKRREWIFPLQNIVYQGLKQNKQENQPTNQPKNWQWNYTIILTRSVRRIIDFIISTSRILASHEIGWFIHIL